MKWIYFFIFSCLSIFSFGQSDNHQKLIDPKFDLFQGTVYSIPYNMLKKGYGKHIYDFEEIGTIEWEEINIPNQHYHGKFPGVDKNIKFGMVLNSCMTISENSCYEFNLSSDDGSKLWINGQLVLDNDGDHPMKLKKDTFRLAAGTHKIKIWYFQGFPDRFGFIFNAKNVGDVCPEGQTIRRGSCSEEKEIVETKPQQINFGNNIFFNSDEYQIKVDAFSKLDSICNFIKEQQAKKIIIIGHTDNNGAEKYNLELSQKRANSLLHYLMNKINQVGIQYIAKGRGETLPIADNQTEEGRKANRRVEILLE